MVKEKPELSESLFWDVDPGKLDYDKYPRYVIERVVTRGKFKDWEEIKRYYGLETIKDRCLELRSVDPKTLNFLSNIFDIPKEQFRCYKHKQLNPGHWIY